MYDDRQITKCNELIYLCFPPSFHQTVDGKTAENKGKLILTEIFPSMKKHDI